MALQNSNQYTIEKTTDQMITGHEKTTSTNTTSAATTAAEVKDTEPVKPVSPAPESDEQSEDDQPTMDDIGEEEHSADVWDGGSSNTESNDNGTDDFFEDNKELLKKIKNILDFVYPNSKISLAELLTSVKGYVSKYGTGSDESSDNEVGNGSIESENDDKCINDIIKAINSGISYDDFFISVFGDLSLKGFVAEISEKFMKRMEA